MNTPHQEQLYDRWLSEHRAILFKVVRVYASSREDQEDLFQEIALQLWKSVPTKRIRTTKAGAGRD